MTSGDRIAEALFDALTGGGDVDQLHRIVEEFRAKHSRTYHDVCQQPFARKLINAIEDAHRYSAGERP
jgi:hypothetical protein